MFKHAITSSERIFAKILAQSRVFNEQSLCVELQCLITSLKWCYIEEYNEVRLKSVTQAMIWAFLKLLVGWITRNELLQNDKVKGQIQTFRLSIVSIQWKLCTMVVNNIIRLLFYSCTSVLRRKHKAKQKFRHGCTVTTHGLIFYPWDSCWKSTINFSTETMQW